MRHYHDLHEHLAELEKRGLLYRIKRSVNKDTEIHPLVRWQFRGGIPETKRKGFLFENVTDTKGKAYKIPVAVGVLAAQPEIYAIGLQCSQGEINDRWNKALSNPIEPIIVENGPAQEVVYTGDDLLNGFGLEHLPIPISTPGFDNAPYTTCSHWFTKDPETGIRNVGNYRGQINMTIQLTQVPSEPAATLLAWQMDSFRQEVG